MVNQRTVDDDWHKRLGTLHPALQWHRDKMFSPNRAIRHANLRVSPELDHDPENRIIQNINDGAKTGKELFEGLTNEQVHAILDVHHDRSRGGRILDVPTMRSPNLTDGMSLRHDLNQCNGYETDSVAHELMEKNPVMILDEGRLTWASVEQWMMHPDMKTKVAMGWA